MQSHEKESIYFLYVAYANEHTRVTLPNIALGVSGDF